MSNLRTLRLEVKLKSSLTLTSVGVQTNSVTGMTIFLIEALTQQKCNKKSLLRCSEQRDNFKIPYARSLLVLRA